MDVKFYTFMVFIIIVLCSPSKEALNNPCSDNADCTDVNGICGANRTCVCNTNQYVSGDICAHMIVLRVDGSKRRRCIHCGSQPSNAVTSGTALLTTGSTTISSTASVSCNTGYETSTTTITCRSDGQWSTAICTVKDCGSQASNAVTSGTASLTSASTTFSSTASVSCNTGYATSITTITCRSDGQWSTAICTIKDCGSLPSNAVTSGTATLTSGSTTYSSTAIVNCNTGYTTSRATITCRSNGQWSTAICTIKDCGSQPSNAVTSGSASLTTGSTTYSSTASVSCNTGYATSATQITCRSNGQWSTATCIIKDCEQIPTHAVTFGTATLQSGTTYSSTATVMCNTGYESPVTSIICQSNRQWSVAVCSIKDCGQEPPNAVTFGTATPRLGASTYLSTATVNCNSGYETLATQITCQSDGHWSTSRCTIMDCGQIPSNTVTLGTATLTLGTTTYLSTADVSCNIGHKTQTTEVICEYMGQWTTAICSVQDCGQPTNPANGVVSYTHTTFGAIATYTCNAGYIVTGSDANTFTITCTASGVWSVTYPTCGVKADPLGSACQNPPSSNILPGEMCSGNDAECLPRSDNNQDFTCQCITGFYDSNGNTEAGNCRKVEELRVESVSFTTVTTTAMHLSWTPPTTTQSFINAYVVEWRQSGNFISNATSGTLAGTNYVINSENLISGRSYIVKVISQNTVSYTSTIQTTNVQTEQALKPQKPGEIVTQSSDLDASDQTIEVVWTAPDGYVEMYEVRLMADGTTLSSNVSTKATVLLTYNQIKNGHRYNVSVNAVSEIFDGSYAVKSETHTEEIKTIVKVPSEPRFVVCHMTTTASVTIKWNASLIPNGNIMEYRIYTHSYKNGAFLKVDSTKDTDLEYEITGLQPGSYYYYFVSTINEEYESVRTRLTDSYCATLAYVADAPNNINVSNIQSQSFVVNWTQPTNTFGELMGYVVQVWTSNDRCVFELIKICSDCIQTFEVSAFENMCPVGVSTDETLSKASIDSVVSQNCAVTSLTPDISYTVSVTAVNGAGKGEVASVTIQTDEKVPQKPRDITVLDITSNSCDITWDIDGPRPGATTFDVIISPVSPATFDDIQLSGFDIRFQTISSLEEFWDYNVAIRATTSKGSIESDTIYFKTLSAAPGTVDDFQVVTAGPGGDYLLVKQNSGALAFEKNPDTSHVYQVSFNVTPGVTYEFKVYAINAENENGTEVHRIVTAPTAKEPEKESSSSIFIISAVVVTAFVVLLTIAVATKCVLRRRRIAKVAHTGSNINDEESNIQREASRQVNSAKSAPLTSKMTSDEIMNLIHVNIFSNCKKHFQQNTGEHILGLSREDFRNIFGAEEGVSLFNRLCGSENYDSADDSTDDMQSNGKHIETHQQYSELSDIQRDDVSYENIEMVTS